jgi:predicted nucleotidyltransferase
VSGAALCREAGADAAVASAIERCVHLLRERLGRRLIGLVLTGSFARGEGTVVPVDGHLRVLGDIEFLVILPRGRDYRALRPVLADWSRQVSRALGEQRVCVDVEFGPAEEAYLRKRARPSIFVYDLRTHGRVVWGPPGLLARIPPFGPRDIPPADAVHLVFNRAIEQLDAWDRVDALGGEALLDVAYQRLKLRLDLAGSALAFAGRHVSSYAERPRAFATLLAATPALATLLPPTFADDLARAARAKLVPDVDDVLPAGPAAWQRAWVRAEIRRDVPALAAVLRWELGRLCGGGDAPLPALLERWVGAQPWRRRARQWVKLAMHPMPPPRPVSARRAAFLAMRSTPRALTYAAAATAYLALGEDGPASGAAARLLPLAPPPPASAADERATITAFWRWCIRND